MTQDIKSLKHGDQVLRIVPPSNTFPASVYQGTVWQVGPETLSVNFQTGTAGQFEGRFFRSTGREANAGNSFIVRAGSVSK